MDELVMMEKDGEVIPVHPDIVKETAVLGWKVVEPETAPEPKLGRKQKANSDQTAVVPADQVDASLVG